jgi:hypothetical protein
MSGPFLRLAILLAIFFACLGVIEVAIYLAVAVIKIPALALLPVAAVLAFLVFVGRRNVLATHRRFLDSVE